MKKAALILTLITLSACQTAALIESEGRYVEIAATASIEITQSIEVAPNSARAFLQNGEVISITQLNLYDVNCEVEINTVSESRQLIEPGIFDVLAIGQEESPIVMSKPVMVASLTYAWGSDSPVDIKRYYHFRLSAQDPQSKSQVRALICRGVQDQPYKAMLPTFEEMMRASGQYIIFNL